MTLGQFRKLTADLSDNIEMMQGERTTEFQYGGINTVQEREIEFKDGKLKAKEKCLVIEEE